MNDQTELNDESRAEGQSRLNEGLGGTGERIFISRRRDGEVGTLAKAADGWLLAECAMAGRVVNGYHDGTEKGKHCFNFIAKALLDGVELPAIVEYASPNVELTGSPALARPS